MRAIKYRELRRMYEGLGAAVCCTRLREALEAKHLRAEDFSIRELAETTLTPEFVKLRLDPRAGSGFVPLTEGGFDGVDVTAFQNITGQIVYSKLLEAYQAEEFVLTRMIPATPTRFDGEKIAGVEQIGDKALTVLPGMPYPSFGFGETYIETPSTTKKGLIVPVTKEAIFFDRTNLILSRAAEVGTWLGVNKEKRLIDVAFGIGDGNTYKYKGTTYDTYSVDGSTAGYGGTCHGFTNQITDELVDYTDIDAADQAFAGLTDPATGEPIVITARQLVVMPAYRLAAARILSTTEIKYGADSGTVQAMMANPLAGMGYSYASSALAYSRIRAVGNAGGAESAATAKKWWLYGNLAKAFAYMENWPITVVQAPNNSEAEFQQDVVVRFKASERGSAAVLDPRYVIRSNPPHA